MEIASALQQHTNKLVQGAMWFLKGMSDGIGMVGCFGAVGQKSAAPLKVLHRVHICRTANGEMGWGTSAGKVWSVLGNRSCFVGRAGWGAVKCMGNGVATEV